MRSVVALPLFLLAASASAADLAPPVYPPPPAPVVLLPLWSGFYVGGNIGGGWADLPASLSTTGALAGSFGSANNYLSGVVGGGQFGYNWQSGSLVYGAEADFQATSLQNNVAATCRATLCGVPLSARLDQKAPWFGTVRGRFGYALDTWMIYATGGYAYGRLQTNGTATVAGITGRFSEDSTPNGWTVGGGVELAVARNWSVRAEYLFADLGSMSANWTVPGGPHLSDSSDFKMNVVRTGVNYRF
ncbi:MAG TPA: outer membrane beta-barrel protein [Pseudolabrys sp.]|nr:outer membrane beta-barrel protein [Pseudolabrys sp.]